MRRDYIEKKLCGADLAEHIRKLAFGRANDAVKLAFLVPEQQTLIDQLDLSMVSEVKRGSKGEVEVKLLNRVDLLELLSKMLETNMPRENEAESFFAAMDSAASKLSDTSA